MGWTEDFNDKMRSYRGPSPVNSDSGNGSGNETTFTEDEYETESEANAEDEPQNEYIPETEDENETESETESESEEDDQVVQTTNSEVEEVVQITSREVPTVVQITNSEDEEVVQITPREVPTWSKAKYCCVGCGLLKIHYNDLQLVTHILNEHRNPFVCDNGVPRICPFSFEVADELDTWKIFVAIIHDCQRHQP